LAAKKMVTVYPNPVQNIFRLSSDNIMEQIVVRNLAGQTMFISKLNVNETSIHIGNFAPGSYLVTVKLSNGKFENYKIIKQ